MHEWTPGTYDARPDLLTPFADFAYASESTTPEHRTGMPGCLGTVPNGSEM